MRDCLVSENEPLPCSRPPVSEIDHYRTKKNEGIFGAPTI